MEPRRRFWGLVWCVCVRVLVCCALAHVVAVALSVAMFVFVVALAMPRAQLPHACMRAARVHARRTRACAPHALRTCDSDVLADVDYYHCLQIRQILAADKTEGKKSFFFG